MVIFLGIFFMIEVEKKVLLNKDQLDKLRKQSIFLKKEKISDIYFDNEKCELTLDNKWLRRRMDKFELKIGSNSSSSFVDLYQEITDEKTIREILKLDVSSSLTESLCKKNILPFCSFVTYREKYKLDEINIDIDMADFGEFSYSVGEFEIMVHEKDEVIAASEKLEKKLLDLNIISNVPVQAKLSYYLMKKRPDHYRRLIEAKVILI